MCFSVELQNSEKNSRQTLIDNFASSALTLHLFTHSLIGGSCSKYIVMLFASPTQQQRFSLRWCVTEPLGFGSFFFSEKIKEFSFFPPSCFASALWQTRGGRKHNKRRNLFTLSTRMKKAANNFYYDEALSVCVTGACTILPIFCNKSREKSFLRPSSSVEMETERQRR